MSVAVGRARTRAHGGVAVTGVGEASGAWQVVSRWRGERRGWSNAEAPFENRARLRIAYAAVPAYLQIFCGDMDSKDHPVRRALGLAPDRRGG